MRKLSFLPIALVLTLLLVGQPGTHAQPLKEVVANLPEGLRHVPSDGMAFVYLRTGKFLETKMGKALLKDLLRDEETKDEVKKLEAQLGMSIKDVESVTLVSLEPAPESPRGFRQPEMKMPVEMFEKKEFPIKKPTLPKPPAEEKKDADLFSEVGLQAHENLGGVVALQRNPFEPAFVVIVTANKPLDRKKLVKQLMFGGGPPGPQTPPSFLFLSDHSLALGDPRSLIRFADSGTAPSAITGKLGKDFGGGFGGGRSPWNSLQGAMALAKENHVLVAGFRMPAALKKQFIAQMDRMGGMPRPEITFFPLLNVAWAGLTVDLEKDGADLQFHLRGRTLRGAELAAESAKAGLTLAELAIETLQNLDKKAADSAWLPAIKKTLASVKIKREGTMINMEARADLDPKMIQLALAEITDKVKQSGARQRSQNNLKQIALAMHNYHDTYRGFPPPALTSKDKKPLLSWRVVILPFIEQAQLYRQFKMDEPWDSEHNKKLIPLMPSIYADPRGKNKEPGMTYYQVFVGPGTVFEPFVRPSPNGLANVRIPNDIPDGTSNTIMAVEAGKPVIWTKPDDLPFNPDSKTLPPLGGLFPDGFNAALCDGSVRFIRRTVPVSTLRLLIIRNDGMPIPEY